MLCRAIIVCLFSAVVLHGTATADVYAEYKERIEVVQQLSNLFKEFTDGMESPDNETLRQNFEDYYTQHFDNSDEWIMNTLQTDSQITDAAMKEAKYSYSKMEKFFRDLRSYAKMAFVANIHYCSLQENTDQIEAIQIGLKTVDPVVDQISQRDLAYIKTTAWKKQFKIDVYQYTSDAGEAIKAKSLYNFLAGKYPFRDWVVLIRPTSTHPSYTSICAQGPSTKVIVSGKSMLVQVFQADPDRRLTGREDYLDNLRDEHKSWFSCTDSDDILEESEYDCRSKKLSLFAATRVDDVSVQLAGGKSLIHKTVQRAAGRVFGLRCKRFFLVAIL